jgi:hypothetical protein
MSDSLRNALRHVAISYHLNTISEIILCCRKMLKEILKKEGKIHKDIFGKDFLFKVRQY